MTKQTKPTGEKREKIRKIVKVAMPLGISIAALAVLFVPSVIIVAALLFWGLPIFLLGSTNRCPECRHKTVEVGYEGWKCPDCGVNNYQPKEAEE